MNQDEFLERVAEVWREAGKQLLKESERLWWLSFADHGFKGAIIVEASGIENALTICNLLGINPGGEVWAVALAEGACDDLKPEDRNRLIGKEEIEERWGLMRLDELNKR